MNESDKALGILSKSICDTFFKMIPKLPFDRTYQGKISKVLSNNQYEVEISGAKYTAYSSTDLTFTTDDLVWITAPQNDFDNIFINGKRH